MNICAFGKYRVDLRNNYTYTSDKEFGEYTYSKGKEEWTKDMQGGELMNLISDLMQDKECIDICDTDKIKHTIAITLFNPDDGTGNDIIISYKILPDSISEIK